MKIFKTKLSFNSLVMLIISLTLTFVWFRKGIMLATAEEGLPFYNLSRTIELYTSTFYDTGLGINGIFNIQRIPFYFFSYFLYLLRLPSWSIQFVIYFLLLLTPLISVSKLVSEIFPKLSKHVGLIAGLFYLLNLFTLSQVWTRFVSSLIFLWSYLPLFLLLWILYLKVKNFKYLIYLIISSVIFSNTFVILSPVITLWFCAGIYLLTQIFKSKEKMQLIKYSMIGLFAWFVFNLWWIFPIVSLNNNLNATSLNSNQNLQSLIDVSKFYSTNDVLSLRQQYMFGEQSPYYDFYSNELTKKLSTILFIMSVFGVLIIIRRKYSIYFILLFLVGWFVSKGANPPFGTEFYQYLFTNFPFLQVYRNPYEKFGVVLVLGYSTLIAIFISEFVSKIKYFRYTILIVILMIFCGYLVLPMWNGKLFKNTSYVIVPEYYEAANKYINQNSKQDSRIFQLPFLRASVVEYDWNYIGEEPSEFLFDKPSISRTSSNPILDDFYLKLGEPKYFRNNPYFSNILSLLNIEYIVLHKDLIFSKYYQEGSGDTKRFISQWQNVNFQSDFDKLSVYSLKNNPGRLYAVNELANVTTLDQMFDYVTKSDFDPTRQAIILNGTHGTLLNEYAIPKYDVKKLDDRNYKIKIFNSNKPFILILANNFSPSWKGSINNVTIDKHFMVNGYANGWEISRLGDYEIDIIFKIWPWE